MGGKSVTLTQQEPRLSNIRVQTSSQGIVIPKGWGRFRQGCNLVWYNNFKAIEHRSVQEQGGKGGGGGVKQVTITYTYEASIIVVLGHGPINGVVSAWKGKERLQGEAVGERIATVSHEFDMPDLDGNFNRYFNNGNAGGDTHVVTVPNAANYAGPVKVVRVSTSVSRLKRTLATLAPLVHYTRSGGTYTFNRNCEPGRYRIDYQVVETPAGWLSALGQLNLSMASGTVEQPVWPWLEAEYPEEALNYPGMAYLYSQTYSLNSAAELYNHNFEVSTPSELGMLPGRTEPVLDADPAVIVTDVVTDDTWSAGWQGATLTGLDRYSDYCVANGIWLSPVLEEQTTAAALLQDQLKLTNTDVVWDGAELIFVPLGDQDVTGNGRTFVADTTPVVDLDFDTMMSTSGRAPLKIRRHYGQDGSSELETGDDVGYNIWTLEIENRANGYTTEPVSYEDTAHILQHGRRPKPTIKAKAIKEAAIGQAIATLLCQAELAKRNLYEFSVPWTMGFLRPLHLVTLTDSTCNLLRKPVRLLTVDEEEDEFICTAVSCDIGEASAPAYGAQAGTGYAQDYGVAPGPVADPILFEPPVALVPETGLAVWVAVTGTTTFWGGAEVWASLDGGVTYRRVGDVKGGARYGTLAASLAAGPGGSMDLQLAGRGGQMLGASAEDAAVFESLLYVRNVDGSQAEYLAHEGATLTGTNRYTLGGLVRGGYKTAALAKPAGSLVVRVDDLVVRGEPLQLSMIGKSISFKFLSYNVFGSALESLEDVTEYVYQVSGDMVRLAPSDVTAIAYEFEEFGVRLRWPDIADGDRAGYVLRFGGASWESATYLVEKNALSHLWAVQESGTRRVWIKAKDALGNLSENSAFVDVVIPVPSSVTMSASIQGPDVVFTWPASAGAFAIDRYELRHGATWEAGTLMAEPRNSAHREKVRYGGARKYWIAASDVAGNRSEPTSLDVTITVPGSVQSTRSEVVDNNALLYWSPPITGTLPVERYEVRKGASYAGGTVVGSNGNSTFTTVFEQQSGSYQYWVMPFDSAGNSGVAVPIAATIQQPPDYVLRTDFNSVFAGTKTNMYLEGGVLYGPVNTSESWSTHFSSRGWTTPQDQITAGFPLYINPSLTSGSYVEEIDHGSALPSTIVTVTPGFEVLQGSVTVACQIAYKLNVGDAWTDAAAGELQALLPSFRYVRVTLTFTCTAGANLVALQSLNIKLSNKLRTDSGKGTANASDVGGTTVLFGVPFIDADTPIVQPAGSAPRFAVVDFLDNPNPTSFKVLLYDIDGVRVSGDFSWTARGY